jgi:hypothetical protein
MDFFITPDLKINVMNYYMRKCVESLKCYLTKNVLNKKLGIHKILVELLTFAKHPVCPSATMNLKRKTPLNTCEATVYFFRFCCCCGCSCSCPNDVNN